jgi:ESS family glutamate:Na+ symporter
MELIEQTLRIETFMAVTLGIVVLFVGKRINASVTFLRDFSIPEPVSGGLVFSLLFALIYFVTGIGVEFSLAARDMLLIYFFTTIGINASFRDLMAGGRPLALLLAITVVYMVAQNFIGTGVATLLGQPHEVGLIGGTVSLIGGHGTSIAWAPRFEEMGITGASEIGIASATFGLILASLMGGPLAKFLIQRHQLSGGSEEPLDFGTPIKDDEPSSPGLTYLDFLDAVLAIHAAIILGYFINEGLEQVGVQLPMFVTCLFGGILLTNLRPGSWPRITGTEWPSRKPAVALIADISLGTFLAMSLMSMQLWTLVDLAGPILAILAAQTALTVAFALLIVFRVMGGNYDAAVVSAGFGGYALGATPTAIANMSAVTQRYGASHLAFITVPLVGAFFIDLVNAALIPLFL